MNNIIENIKDKKVLITGVTGFKGSWLALLLKELGAKVYGYSLNPPTTPNLFTEADILNHIDGFKLADVCDIDSISKYINEVNADVVFHLAAQPIVLKSYEDPLLTYKSNVMGTATVLEAIRQNPCVKVVINVTTDKVYENNDSSKAFVETDRLNGFDPYSNSKSCSELVTDCYKNAFFKNRDISIFTVRAGNVIGGGDFAENRIIPDCVRAVIANESIKVRNKYSIRPYEHVLDALYAYVLIASYGLSGLVSTSYNVGPDDDSICTTGELVDSFCSLWMNGASWVDNSIPNAPHEASCLKLDCTKLKSELDWSPVWGLQDTIKYTVEWYKKWVAMESTYNLTLKQIKQFLSDC